VVLDNNCSRDKQNDKHPAVHGGGSDDDGGGGDMQK